MIRIIVRLVDYGAAAHGMDLPVAKSFLTFDIEANDLERWLSNPSSSYQDREVIGVEVIPRPE